jgi:hypothetical protein
MHADIPLALRVTGVMEPVIAIAIVTATRITIGTKDREKKSHQHPTNLQLHDHLQREVCLQNEKGIREGMGEKKE